MSGNKPPTSFEKNLVRLLKAAPVERADAAASEPWVRAVLAEVRQERDNRAARRRPWWRSRAVAWSSALAAAALVLVVFAAWRLLAPGNGPGNGNIGQVGQVRAVYGLVAMETGAPAAAGQSAGQPSAVGTDKWAAIGRGTRVRTRWGSQAEILLADQSRLLSRSQTTLELESGRQGEKVFLREGWLSVEAAKQRRGKVLRIETPGALVSVLGTKFDVHLVQKPSGRSQTRVSVAEGRVELESAGRKVFLPPNTEGVADEGLAPERRCLTPEVNELLRLAGLNEKLAREQGLSAGSPAIVEFHADATATVWLLARPQGGEKGKMVTLRLKGETSGAEAYTLEGEPLGVSLAGDKLQVRLGGAGMEAKADGRLILKLSGVKGLFLPRGSGSFEAAAAGGEAPELSLYQFRLPDTARIDQIEPRPIETVRSLSRQAVTLALRAKGPELVD